MCCNYFLLQNQRVFAESESSGAHDGYIMTYCAV